MTYLGIALIAGGIGWWLWPKLMSGQVTTPTPSPISDPRTKLFWAFTLVCDHVDVSGTPEQKAALLVVLPAIVAKGPT